MDNVFIGSNTTVLGGVRIGPNVIVAAGSLINKDVPPNTVVAGVPAKVIGNFKDFEAKRRAVIYPYEMKIIAQSVPVELEEYMWSEFKKKHDYHY